MRTPIITHHHLLLVGTLLALGAASLTAQSVPALINYQGRLSDSADLPLPPGTYGLAFRLWDRQSLDSDQRLIWGREYDVAIFEGGAFSVILGDGGRSLTDGPTPAVNDLAFAFGEPNRFLGLMITHDADGQAILNPSELIPRQRILSAPYAIFAESSANAANVVDGAITTSKIVENAVTTDRIAPGAITNDRLSDKVVSVDKLGDGLFESATYTWNNTGSISPQYNTSRLTSDWYPILTGFNFGTGDLAENGTGDLGGVWFTELSGTWRLNAGARTQIKYPNLTIQVLWIPRRFVK